MAPGHWTLFLSYKITLLVRQNRVVAAHIIDLHPYKGQLTLPPTSLKRTVKGYTTTTHIPTLLPRDLSSTLTIVITANTTVALLKTNRSLINYKTPNKLSFFFPSCFITVYSINNVLNRSFSTVVNVSGNSRTMSQMLNK